MRVCNEDSQVLGGLELAGIFLELGVLPSPGRSGGSWGLYACGFPAERPAQGLGANWEQVAGLANAAELVTVVLAGQGWYPKDVPEVTGIHTEHQNSGR